MRAVPRPAHLIAILEYIEHARNVRGVRDARRLLRTAQAHVLINREELERLVASALASAVAQGVVPRKAVMKRGRVVELLKNGKPRRRPPSPGETTVEVYDPEPADFGLYNDDKLLDVLVLLSDPDVYSSPAASECTDLVASLVRQVGAAVATLIEQREEESSVPA